MSIALRTRGGNLDIVSRMDPAFLQLIGKLTTERVDLLGIRDPALAAREVVRTGTAADATALQFMAAAPGVAKITAGSAQDRGNGVGAQAVTLEGWTADGELVQRTFDLSTSSGTTTDTGGPSFVHVHRLRVTRYGANGSFNSGTLGVDIGAVTPTTHAVLCDATIGLSRQAILYVPRQRYGILDRCELVADGTNSEQFVIWTRRFRSTRNPDTLALTADGNGNATLATGPILPEYIARTTSTYQVPAKLLIPPDSLVLVTRNGASGAGELAVNIGMSFVPVDDVEELAAA